MEFLDNMKIGKKLIGGFLIVAIILAIIAMIGYVNMKNINDGMTTMYYDRLVPINQLGNVDADIYEIRGDIYKYLSIPEKREEIRSNIDLIISRVEKEIDLYRATTLTDIEKKELSTFDTQWSEFKTIVKNTMEQVDTGKQDEAVQSLTNGAMTKSRTAVAESVDTLKENNVKTAEETNTQADATFAASTLAIILAGILGFLAALILGFMISRSISIPLGRGVAMLQEIGAGHLSDRLKMNRKDEIGILAGTMDTFADYLQHHVIETIQKVADGERVEMPEVKDKADEIGPAIQTLVFTLRGLTDETSKLIHAAKEGQLTARGDASHFKGRFQEIVTGVNEILDSVIIPVNEAMRLSGSYSKGDYTDRVQENITVKGDFIRFKDALNQIGIQGSSAIRGVITEVESLTAEMEETNASAEEVSSTTGMLAQSSASVSGLAERCGSGINQTLTAMEDLSSTVSAVASKAEQASGMAKQSVDLSEKGVVLAGKAEKGMEGIMHSVDETNEIITDIAGQMEEIGKIVDVITGIAEQTGLLALNAAIEAARAGDAGMGFAVVADEVKALALESQKSAENIASIIGTLQKKSHRVTESMKASSIEVKAGNEAVIQTLEVFNEIAKAINIVNNNMTEVAGAAEEQAAAVEEITASVHEVGSLVQQTAKEAVDSAGATEEVTASIDQISKAISDAAVSIEKISGEMRKFTVA
jgi:methyl-accepting chemotaxis protein